jgi:anthranilate phosphoribosyltransferase
MAVRTIFNVLGPLTNPAGAPNLLIGVYAAEWVEPLARVMQRLGAEHVLVVHSEDGLDEISIGAATQVAELKGRRGHDLHHRPHGLRHQPERGRQFEGRRCDAEPRRGAPGPRR